MRTQRTRVARSPGPSTGLRDESALDSSFLRAQVGFEPHRPENNPGEWPMEWPCQPARSMTRNAVGDMHRLCAREAGAKSVFAN